jgi:ANTAR domain-containing protein
MNDERGFVALTDLLADGVESAVQRNRLAALCADLLDVRAATLLALDDDGLPVLEATSEETVDRLTRLELASRQGPGVDALRISQRMDCADLTAAGLRWPQFAPAALDAGFAAVCGVPYRLWGRIVGALTLYMSAPGTLSAANVAYGSGLALTVSLGVTAHRGRALAVRAEQLQGALNSRVSIEQAKGVLAERSNITVDEAFVILRDHARHHGTKMHDVARAVVVGTLQLPTG